MRIENEVIEFHPQCQFSQLNLTDLQKQYLADMQNKNSIKSLVERYLFQGWLVNFNILFDLIANLALHNWILNPNIVEYFKNLKMSNELFSKNTLPSSIVNTNYTEETFLKLPFFRSLSKDLALFLLSHSKVMTYSAESLICKTGDSSRDLFVLLKGQAAVYTQANHFKQFISMISEEGVFGESGFFLGEPRKADVVALKTSEVLVISYQKEILDKVLQKDKAQQLQQRFWLQHALLHSDFFKKIPADCFDDLVFSGRIVDLQDQQVLFSQGDKGHSAYIVIQGSLLVSQNGKIINTLPQGAFLGEVSLMLNDGKRTATISAQRNTKLLEIQRNEYYKILSRNLYLAKELQILADQRLQRDVQRQLASK